jgi:Fe-S cluster biogenesis protein NfuA
MNTNQVRHVHLYTEASPNPNSIKIVLNQLLTPEGQNFNFTRSENYAQSPLVAGLFDGFSWISQVFLMNNFLTLTRNSDSDWYELLAEVKPFLKTWFEENRPVFQAGAEAGFLGQQLAEPSGEIEKQIVDVLEEYVRPAVESDGGAISFHSFQDGVVQVELRGSCSGCPSSALTLKQGIENLLTRMVPGVREVVAVNR